MTKSEAKYHNTSLKMYSALFELVDKKPFNSINIKELCELANINRSTFYSHYDSLLDLLEDAKKYVIEKFFNSFKENLLLEEIPLDDSKEHIVKNYIIPYLKFVKKNKIVFKAFVNNLQTFNSDKYYEFLLEKVFVPILSKKGITNDLTIRYFSIYYLTGVTSIIMEWIKRDCTDDIKYISNIILDSNKYTLM